jgi:hypothetical protein
MYSIVQAYR